MRLSEGSKIDKKVVRQNSLRGNTAGDGDPSRGKKTDTLTLTIVDEEPGEGKRRTH